MKVVTTLERTGRTGRGKKAFISERDIISCVVSMLSNQRIVTPNPVALQRLVPSQQAPVCMRRTRLSNARSRHSEMTYYKERQSTKEVGWVRLSPRRLLSMFPAKPKVNLF